MANNADFAVGFAIDCETSGINFNSVNHDITEDYQSVAWGIVAFDSTTFKELDSLYVEIKWDKVSIWSNKAEKVHGLTREYLDENGVSGEEAAALIGEFILQYLHPDDPIVALGANVARFDIPFLRKLLHENGLTFKFAHRSLDTFSLCLPTVGGYSSDEYFEILGIEREVPHNALSDARAALAVFRKISKAWKKAMAAASA